MIADLALTQAFRAAVSHRLGLQFSDDKLDLLRDALRQRALEGRYASPHDYVQRLSAGDVPRDEQGRLAEVLTVTETYFFRNAEHFRALAELALPARIRARSAELRLNLLSAACASGEEPYTLAMILDSQFPELRGWDVQIGGVDINPAMLAKARQARYGAWSLRDTPLDAKERFFKAEGAEFRVRDDLRERVRFEERNLCEEQPDLWPSGRYDIIFCRNMLMYLVPAQAAALVARMARALQPGGFLFLGYAETLRGLSQDFHLCHTHDTFYYQRLEEGQRSPAAWMPSTQAPRAIEPAPALGQPLAWMEDIQRASERIAGLAARSQAALPAATAWSLAPALELLGRERYDQALELLQALPAGSTEDPEALLLHAVLLSNAGRLPEAEAVCRTLLQRDELNAGAHYVLALCREHAGDLAGALEQDRTALYLDSLFAMPWLHQGLLARRQGDAAQAKLCFEQALDLLAREDAARILLFGGGFGREGLSTLCRESLGSLEGRR